MDTPKQLIKQRALDIEDASPAEQALADRLDALVQTLLYGPQDVVVMGEAMLEGILDLLGFERGFVVAAGEVVARPSQKEPEHGEILASRLRRAEGGSAAWGSVRNPEFAVSRALIKRAVQTREPILVNDCLIPSAQTAEAQHRSVICQSFELSRGMIVVLYLDRGLGTGELGETERGILRSFAERCFVVFLRAYALVELEKLRAKVGSRAREEAPEPGGEDEPEEPAILPEESPSFFGIVGQDEKLQKIFHVIHKIKDSDLSVCIFGESGTGKELLARAIHEAGNRRQFPFVAENCGAIPENLLESELFGHVKGAFTGADEDKKGLFETATRGTLFLDEIGDMSEGMQRKLLRVLQEGVVRPIGGKQPIKVDVRVICASNRDLKTLVQKGVFRADLYYRLNVITLELPPLRERAGDIPALIGHLASKICQEEGIRKRFSQSALRACSEYPWPGNIRELRNVLRRVLITSPGRIVVRKDLKGYLSGVSASPRSGENIERDDKDLILRVPVKESFNEIIEECERVVLLNALKQCAWNKSRVTKALKIPRQSLYNKIAKYDLVRDWPGSADDAEE